MKRPRYKILYDLCLAADALDYHISNKESSVRSDEVDLLDEIEAEIYKLSVCYRDCLVARLVVAADNGGLLIHDENMRYHATCSVTEHRLEAHIDAPGFGVSPGQLHTDLHNFLYEKVAQQVEIPSHVKQIVKDYIG